MKDLITHSKISNITGYLFEDNAYGIDDIKIGKFKIGRKENWKNIMKEDFEKYKLDLKRISQNFDNLKNKINENENYFENQMIGKEKFRFDKETIEDWQILIKRFLFINFLIENNQDIIEIINNKTLLEKWITKYRCKALVFRHRNIRR